MPVSVSYPGVYVEEIPSGVRSITGVPTSVAAFVGRALRGPSDEAVVINSYADFERVFGGLWLKSTLGYAVQDFYRNGGSQAIIVRLYRADEGNGAKPAKSLLAVGGVSLEAAYEGAWGANLRVTVDKENVTDDVAAALGVAKADLFNITVRDAGAGGITEKFINLTVKDTPRSIDRVLKAASKLVRWQGALDYANPPAVSAAKDAVTVKEDALIAARKALSAKLIADPAADVSAEQAAVDAAVTALDAAKAAMIAAVSDGQHLNTASFLPANGETDKKGLYALEQADLFNLLCIPPYSTADSVSFDVDTSLLAAAAAYCEKRRAMLIVDAPSTWNSKDDARNSFSAVNDDFPGIRSKNAALFFPRINQPNILRENRIEEFAPCGVVAGIFARTDTQRGVWKAPAGLEATLVGVPQLEVNLTDAENGELNQLGINCLRSFPNLGRVLWGARTLRGADQLADEWKYIPVRRTALYLEESLFRGLKWVVFEPNDEPLWAQIRLNVGAFMHNLFRQGAFQGRSPREAYLVKCDSETTTQNDINLGIVNIVVGFAPLKPAEFVIIKLQQLAGQVQS
jgi:phage tail sheath protein FI